jgi:ABC-type sugar transport system ATPase subunit
VLETTEAERLATGFIFTEGPLWHPRLNLLEGEVVAAPGGGTSVQTAVTAFPARGLAGITGPVQVGIRPEWLRLSPRPVADTVPLEIALVEPLGAEILVHARWPGGELVARVAADSALPEQGMVWIDAAASRLDLFDTEGRRIGDARCAVDQMPLPDTSPALQPGPVRIR